MKKDILKVFFPNLIKLFATVITVFLVPKIISVDEYGYIKVYNLLASYIGLSSLGFCDGSFIKHGGLSVRELSSEEISTEQKSLCVWQLIFTILFVIIGIISRDNIVILFGLSFVPNMFITYFLTLTQSVGAFSDYGKIYNTHSILTILSNLICLFVIKTQSAIFFICAIVFVNYFCMIVVLFLFNSKYHIKGGSISFRCIIDNIKVGVLITAGNMAYVVFSGIDKWFVKINEGLTNFSYYSFAVELLAAINMFANPIAYTLFNYFNKRKSKAFELYVKRAVLIWIFFLLNGVYVLKMIVKAYIPKYEIAIPIMVILFLSQIFYSLNYSIYVNLFKMYKKQRAYFSNLLFVILISVITNAIFYFGFRRNMLSLAFATLICMIIWALINLRSFPYLKLGKKDLMYVSILIITYLLTNYFSSDVVALIVYFIVDVLGTRLLMNDIFDDGVSEVKSLVTRKRVIKN